MLWWLTPLSTIWLSEDFVIWIFTQNNLQNIYWNIVIILNFKFKATRYSFLLHNLVQMYNTAMSRKFHSTYLLFVHIYIFVKTEILNWSFIYMRKDRPHWICIESPVYKNGFFPVYTVKEYSEAVMRKTDSTMAKRKRTEGHERQTLQWPKEKGQKDKQWSTKQYTKN